MKWTIKRSSLSLLSVLIFMGQLESSSASNQALLCAGAGGLMVGVGAGLGESSHLNLGGAGGDERDGFHVNNRERNGFYFFVCIFTYLITGAGIGYLIFWYPLRNSGGVWLGRGGAGFWLPQGKGRRRRSLFENSFIDSDSGE